MSQNWTSDQLEAIETTDRAVIVSAAAGSGKTAVLIERTIRMLMDEEKQIPADKLLAVTFTNDAASQMREKLNNALNAKIEQDPTNEWLQVQQMKLQMAKIATINAFCLDLVKNNIHEFEISSGVRILDETEYSVMLANSINTIIEKYYTEKPDIMSTLNGAFCVGDDKNLAEIILQLFNFSRSLPFKDSWFKTALEGYDEDSEMFKKWRETIFDDLISKFEETQNMVTEAFNISKKLKFFSKTKEVIEKDFIFVNSLLLYFNGREWDKIAQNISQIKWDTFSKKPDKKAPDESQLEQKTVEYLAKLRDMYKADIKSLQGIFVYSENQISVDLMQNKEILEHLISIVNDIWIELWEQKVLKNAIDFADVEILSIQLLAEETENGYEKTQLAKDIVSGNDYKIILIDEFQDVNNLQDIIFKMLSNSDVHDIIGKNMFVVGDLKQSIYRFRQANPKIFIKTRNDARLQENSRRLAEIKLKKNFRSRKCVIDFVNFVFEKIMSSELGEVDYDADEALDLGANYDDRELETEVLVIDNLETDESDDDDDEKPNIDEPVAVARKIKQMLSDGEPVFENGVSRPCKQGDFCVLMRSKTVNKDYLKAFKDVGLLAQSEELTGYLRSREISILINMLQVIDNPMNEIALVAVLLSPIFMFNADELAEIRTINRNMKIYTIMLGIIGEDIGDKAKKMEVENAELVEKCKAVVEKIRELRFYSSSLTLESLINKIYDSTDFFSLASTFKDSTQKRANLRLLLEYANSYDKGISGGLTGFVRYINAIFKNGGDLKQAGIINSNSDAVVIKTIHKSKGLEFPFVFLCRSSTQFRQQKLDLSKTMLINLYNGIGFRFKNNKNFTKYTTFPYDAIKISNEKEMLSEEMRLLYVAMTRAKERLFITFLRKKTTDTIVQKIAMKISRTGGVSPSIVKSANSMQDWLVMALLMYENDDYLRQICGEDFKIPTTKSEAKITFNVQKQADKTAECENEACDGESEVTEVQPNSEIVAEIKRYINFDYDFSRSKTTSKLSVSEVAKKDSTLEFFYQIPKLNEQKGQLSPAEKGTATHAFMELANYDNACENVENEIERLVSIGLLSKKQGKGINKTAVQAFFDGDFFARMKMSKNVLREKQFLVRISQLGIDDEELLAYNGTDGMLQGIADCLFEEADGYVLVDYKTDNVKNVSELTEHYTLQLKLYKRSFDLILDKPVKSSYIYSFKLEQGVEVEL